MELNKAKKILTQCINALPKPDRRRIGYHAEKKTPVLCGPKMKKGWLIKDDGIALAVLASTRSIPKKVGKNVDNWARRDAILKGSHRHFAAAMRRISSKSLHKIMLSYA